MFFNFCHIMLHEPKKSKKTVSAYFGIRVLIFLVSKFTYSEVLGTQI